MRLVWLLFAILFYQSGLNFTQWLLEPASFAGGLAWFWVALFPFLVPMFFIVNRYLGCASGLCRSDSRDHGHQEPGATQPRTAYHNRPPGI
jgi:hypothetical protein